MFVISNFIVIVIIIIVIWPVAVLAKTLWGAGPTSAEWGWWAIISSRWQNWGADKK